jgi:hypothetical protein
MGREGASQSSKFRDSAEPRNKKTRRVFEENLMNFLSRFRFFEPLPIRSSKKSVRISRTGREAKPAFEEILLNFFSSSRSDDLSEKKNFR